MFCMESIKSTTTASRSGVVTQVLSSYVSGVDGLLYFSTVVLCSSGLVVGLGTSCEKLFVCLSASSSSFVDNLLNRVSTPNSYYIVVEYLRIPLQSLSLHRFLVSKAIITEGIFITSMTRIPIPGVKDFCQVIFLLPCPHYLSNFYADYWEGSIIPVI